MTNNKISIPGLTEEDMKKHPIRETAKTVEEMMIQKTLDEMVSGKRDDFAKKIMYTPPGQIPFSALRPDIREILRDSMRPHPQGPSGKKQKLARDDQLTRERCQTAAKLLWKENPDLLIADVAQHPNVYNVDITGGRSYDLRTVRDWVAEVFPKGQKKQIGRPRKKLK